MKLNGINLNNFYTNKSNNIQNRNIKSYQTSPILKTNKSDSVSFTGYMEHFNDVMKETLLDAITFENLHKKGVKLQKDAELRKKEALKLRLLYNIKANEFQELYNEMIENDEIATIDEDGNDVMFIENNPSNKELAVLKDGNLKFVAEFENGKIKLICSYSEDGSANVLTASENDFIVMCNAVKKDKNLGWEYQRLYHIYANNQMTCDDGIEKVKNEDDKPAVKIKKHYYYKNGELKAINLDVESDSISPTLSKTKESYYYNGKSLHEIRTGEKSLNGAFVECSKSCIYDENGVGIVYRNGFEVKSDGSIKVDRVFLPTEMSFLENVVKNPKDNLASAQMSYAYLEEENKISVRPNITFDMSF